MDVPTLILLGAAGGLLRGALDVYTRFVSWQADRRAHRQLTAAGTAEGEAPGFQAYFDPAVDVAAAVVHGVMGAGAAVLFGTTGQISGGYAALVVGISAPMLLTQLGRVQTVNEAMTGERQPAGAVPDAPAAGEADAGVAGVAGAPAAPAAPAPPVPPAPAMATPAATPPDRAPSPEPPVPERRRTAAAADTSLPADPADGPGSGLDARGAPGWRQGPAIGEEGL